jgi:hypothetical protein
VGHQRDCGLSVRLFCRRPGSATGASLARPVRANSQRFAKFPLGKADGKPATPHATASIARVLTDSEDVDLLNLIGDLDVLVQDGAFNEVSERTSC